MKTWYFITYLEDNGERVLTDSYITSTHPVRWLYDYGKDFPKVKANILFWSEIPDLIAEEFEDEL